MELPKRCLVTGALAGVVLDVVLTAGFFFSHWLPEVGLDPAMHRTVELLPFVVVGGAAFVVGVGAFALALGLSLRPTAPRRRRKRLRPARSR